MKVSIEHIANDNETVKANYRQWGGAITKVYTKETVAALGVIGRKFKAQGNWDGCLKVWNNAAAKALNEHGVRVQSWNTIREAIKNGQIEVGDGDDGQVKFAFDYKDSDGKTKTKMLPCLYFEETLEAVRKHLTDCERNGEEVFLTKI